jgi:hypothetical protein
MRRTDVSGSLSENLTVDDETDTVVIYGIRYSGWFFRSFGLDPEGTCLRIRQRGDNGTIILERTTTPLTERP